MSVRPVAAAHQRPISPSRSRTGGSASADSRGAMSGAPSLGLSSPRAPAAVAVARACSVTPISSVTPTSLTPSRITAATCESIQ
jgi:hypothetical protein